MTKNLLDLSGKQLEQELDRIAKENPPRGAQWTPKELEILQKLRSRRVSAKKIAKVLGRSVSSVWNRVERH